MFVPRTATNEGGGLAGTRTKTGILSTEGTVCKTAVTNRASSPTPMARQPIQTTGSFVPAFIRRYLVWCDRVKSHKRTRPIIPTFHYSINSYLCGWHGSCPCFHGASIVLLLQSRAYEKRQNGPFPGQPNLVAAGFLIDLARAGHCRTGRNFRRASNRGENV